MTLRVAVLASGRGSNLESLLAKIDEGLVDARVSLVVTDRPGAPCLEKARACNVAALVELPPQVGELRGDYDARLAHVLHDENPDLIILAGFMRILSPGFCDAFSGRIINIHPALLPAFRGANGVRDTLRSGAKIAGCTTHYVTAELDSGPIILQAALAIRPGETQDRLAARVLALEHQILPRTVQLIAEGRVSQEAVHIEPGPSWRDRTERVEGALYPEGF